MSKKARIPAAIRASIFARFTCCAACGTWDADECGHLAAEANGGAMTADNFVRLCGACNRTQGTASVRFAAYATYSESPAEIRTRRAYWAKYCSFARSIKVKPYNPE